MTTKRSTKTLTRVAFGVIIIFVIVQVAWWLIFQHDYITRFQEATLDSWQNDVITANSLMTFSRDPGTIEALLRDHPHLLYTNGSFQLNPEWVSEFTEEQQGFLRMFAFESSFFVLVVLSGLAIIAGSLRSERELKRRQQNFLSAITHEFKTPMSTLRLLVETALMRNLSPEKQQDYLKRMNGELTRLEHTSEQVLAAARLEQSREAPVLKPADLNTVVRDLLTRAKAGLEARGAKLRTSYSTEPLLVSIDQNALTLVINNLLENAVKYSPDPIKTIGVRLERQGDLVFIHVEDEGVGVAEDERNAIFERFYRVGNEMTRSSTGVGLGLHLVKTITESMNGWVQVSAREPRGSRFSVVLPRRVTANQAVAGEPQLT